MARRNPNVEKRYSRRPAAANASAAVVGSSTAAGESASALSAAVEPSRR
jgi:hypothetical protein